MSLEAVCYHLDVIEQCHEAEIHVQLLVAMEQGQAGIIRDEVHLDLLIAAQHHHVLHDTGRRLAGDPHQLETVAVQMNGMDVVAGIHRQTHSIGSLSPRGRTGCG
jgi:hypothetical protein